MWNNKPFVIFFSVAAAISLLFLFLAWRTVAFYDYLLHNGIQTQGKVVEHYVRAGSRGYGQNNYYVYRFLDSRARSHESLVIWTEPDSRLEVGQDIKIIYDPLDPSSNILSIMVPEDIYQPIYPSLKFMVVALGVTYAFGAFLSSRFALTRLRWQSLKRFFGIADR